MVTLHEDQYTFLLYLAEFFLEWGIFYQVVERIKIDILYSINFVNTVPFMRHVEKYCTVGQTRRKYSARALQAGYLRQQIHTQNM